MNAIEFQKITRKTKECREMLGKCQLRQVMPRKVQECQGIQGNTKDFKGMVRNNKGHKKSNIKYCLSPQKKYEGIQNLQYPTMCHQQLRSNQNCWHHNYVYDVLTLLLTQFFTYTPSKFKGNAWTTLEELSHNFATWPKSKKR